MHIFPQKPTIIYFIKDLLKILPFPSYRGSAVGHNGKQKSEYQLVSKKKLHFIAF